MVEETEDRGFLNRWARRKQQSESAESLEQATPQPDLPDTVEEVAELPATVAGETAADDSEPQAVVAEQAALTDEDMPPIDSLNGESDYSPFLSEGVSKELRNIALKKLFFSGKFGIRDGLDDYDDDFTSFEPLGNTVTSDMKFHQRRKERERLAKLEEEQKALEEQARQENDASDDESDAVEEQAAPDQDKPDQDAEIDQEQPVSPPDSEPSALPQLTATEPDDGSTLAGGKLHRSGPVPVKNGDFDKGKNT